MKKILLLAMAAIVCGTTAVHAQDWVLEKLRRDLRADRVAVIEEEMQFTQEEADVFWPVFQKYEGELRDINDQRFKLIGQYAESYENMTNGVARELTKKSLELDIKEAYVRKEYFRRFSNVLPATRAAKFFQVDGMINLLVRTQVSSSLPFIE